MQLTGVTPAMAGPKGPAAGDLRIAQMNVWNLFDTVNDPNTDDDDTTLTQAQLDIKLVKLSNAVVELGLPDVISLNEVENQGVLDMLAARPELKAAGYKAVISALNDERGIRTGILYKGDKLEQVGSLEAPNPTFSFPDGGRGQIDRSLLFARPPLVVDFKLRGAAQGAEGAGLLTIAVNHFKSKLGGAAPEARRQMQGQYLGEWLDARRATRPGGTTIVVGDLNANHGEGAYEKLAKRADGSTRFYDTPLKLKVEDRYTYNYRGQLDLLDHMMIDAGKEDAIKAVRILHVNTEKESKKSQWDPKVLAGYSDHDSIVTDFDAAKLFTA